MSDLKTKIGMFFIHLKGLDLWSYAQVLEKKVIFNTLLQILGWQDNNSFI